MKYANSLHRNRKFYMLVSVHLPKSALFLIIYSIHKIKYTQNKQVLRLFCILMWAVNKSPLQLKQFVSPTFAAPIKMILIGSQTPKPNKATVS